MKFFTAVTALFAAGVAASPVVKRDLASIQTSLATLQSKIAVLNSTVNKFNPKAFSAFPDALVIQQKTVDVGNAVLNTTKVVKASQPLSQDDSVTLGLAVLNGLEPDLFSLLDNLERRKKDFDNVGTFPVISLRKTVLNDLTLDKKLAGDLGAAIKSKLDPAFQPVADQVNSDISNKFDEAIQVYSVKSTTGNEIPAIPTGVKDGKVYRRED